MSFLAELSASSARSEAAMLAAVYGASLIALGLALGRSSRR